MISLSVFICFIVRPAVKPISKLIKLHTPNFKLVDNSTRMEGGEKYPENKNKSAHLTLICQRELSTRNCPY